MNRNSIRGRGFTNGDFSIFRNLKIDERFSLRFRAEAFGLTNTPHFLNPGDNTNGTLCLQSTYSNPANNTFGVITGTLGGGKARIWTAPPDLVRWEVDFLVN